MVLQGQPTETSEVTPEAIERSVEIIRSRVDAFGVAEPEIQTQGSDQIVVALPGAKNPQQVVNDLIAPAQLVFINFERNVVNPQGEPDLYKAVQLATNTTPDQARGQADLLRLQGQEARWCPAGARTWRRSQDSFPDNTIPPGRRGAEGAARPLPRLRGDPEAPDPRRRHPEDLVRLPEQPRA